MEVDTPVQRVQPQKEAVKSIAITHLYDPYHPIFICKQQTAKSWQVATRFGVINLQTINLVLLCALISGCDPPKIDTSEASVPARKHHLCRDQDRNTAGHVAEHQAPYNPSG